MNKDRATALRNTLKALGNPLVQISATGESFLVECRYCKEVHDTVFGFQHAVDCPYEIADLAMERFIFEQEHANE